MDQKTLRKILLVDDDEDILVITKKCLERLNDIEVKCVISGEAAIQSAIHFQPDLILLDVMMPKMDGIMTLEKIRQTPSIAHIPVVFFTAKVQKEEIYSYLRVGAIDVIIKPFDPLILGTTIQKIWENYQRGSNG